MPAPWSTPSTRARHYTKPASPASGKKAFLTLTLIIMKKLLISLSDKQHDLLLYLMEQDLATNKSAWVANLLVVEKLRRDRDTTVSLPVTPSR